jgi:hypothetical protein
MEDNPSLRKGSSAVAGSSPSSKSRPGSQPINPNGRERVSFLLDASDRRKSSSFRGIGDTALDTKAAILTKRLYTYSSPRHQPYFALKLDPIEAATSPASSPKDVVSYLLNLL